MVIDRRDRARLHAALGEELAHHLDVLDEIGLIERLVSAPSAGTHPVERVHPGAVVADLDTRICSLT